MQSRGGFGGWRGCWLLLLEANLMPSQCPVPPMWSGLGLSHQALCLCPKPLGDIPPSCWGPEQAASPSAPFLDYVWMQNHCSS